MDPFFSRLSFGILFCCFLISGSLFAQTPFQKEITLQINQKKFSDAERDIDVLLKTNNKDPFALYSLARIRFTQQQLQKEKDKNRIRHVDFQGYYNLLIEAFKYASKASYYYKELPDAKKVALRKAATTTEDEIEQHLMTSIEQEAFDLLKNAQYRKPTKQLYDSRIYHKTVDSDTLIVLRESLFRQCNQFLSIFRDSKFTETVKDYRKEMLVEYLNLETLRQFGDKSGEKYEKYCSTIIELYEPEKLDHILPQFYGAEFGWGTKDWKDHPNYKKLEQVASQHQLDPLSFMCALSLHFNGCYDGNRQMYIDFITTLAPAEVALVAVKKMAATFILKKEFSEAANIFSQYQGLFSDKSDYFGKLIAMLTEPIVPRQLTNLGPSVNTELPEYYPVLTLDEKRLYFARKTPEYGEDIFTSYSFEDNDWLPAEQLTSNLNTKSHELPLGISADGNTLLLYGNYSILPNYSYLRAKEKNLGKGDFYYTDRIGRGWGRVEVFSSPINTKAYEAGVSISAQREALFFASDREGAVGGYNPIYNPKHLYYNGSGEFNLDIYVTVKDANGHWSAPVNLGEKINTPFAEKNPFIHPDGQTLYFSSDGHYGLGGYDVFMSKRLDDSWTNWSDPVNLGPAINSAYDDSFHMSTTGSRALLVSNREGDSFGKTDIYWVTIPEKYRPEPVVVVSGKIVDDSDKSIEVDMTWEETDNPNENYKLKNHPDNGKFSFALKPGKKYRYYPQKDNYFCTSIDLDLTSIGKSTILKDIKLTMSSIDLTNKERKPFILQTLRFDFDSDVIRPESYYDLDRVAEMLSKNDKVKLSIEGHTDDKGTDDFNLDLSKRRTANVRNYLIKKGIAQDRLTNIGYGETKPVASNATEEGRQINRRVEFRVL